MSNGVWRAYDENPVTHSVAHHLMAIERLRCDRGYARVSDVARELGITRGSVSLTLKGLKQRGLVLEDENRFISLSDAGTELVQGIRAKRAVVHLFLRTVLELPEDIAATDTCKIEHLLSGRTAARMLRFVHLFRGSDKTAAGFRRAWNEAREGCPGLEECPACEDTCLQRVLE